MDDEVLGSYVGLIWDIQGSADVWQPFLQVARKYSHLVRHLRFRAAWRVRCRFGASEILSIIKQQAACRMRSRAMLADMNIYICYVLS